jgi:hypothetical protein
VHNKFNALKSAQNHPSLSPTTTPSYAEKLSSTKPVPDAKKIKDHRLREQQTVSMK